MWVPQGKNLAHCRGFEAKKGYGYEYGDLQDIELHKLQHKYEGYRMSWTPNEKEIEAVLELEGPKRYAHWIKKVADQQEVWSLWHECGWALAGDDAGHELVPVWPHSKYAILSAVGVWADYEAKSIPLEAWLTRWIEGIERDHRLVAVFPTPKDKGVVAEPRRLERDLRKELSQYE